MSHRGEEQWVTFDALPNYVVSDQGRVVNVKYNREVKASRDANGYLRVALYHKGIRKDVFIHRLVARAFLPAFEEGFEILHKDRDKTNNHIFNLERGAGCRSPETLW